MGQTRVNWQIPALPIGNILVHAELLLEHLTLGTCEIAGVVMIIDISYPGCLIAHHQLGVVVEWIAGSTLLILG